MPTLLMHTGKKLDVLGAELKDGLWHVQVPSGSFTVPQTWVKRVEQPPAPQAPPVVAKSSGPPLQENLGRPSPDQPGAHPPIPISWPPQAAAMLPLGHRTDVYDLDSLASELSFGPPDKQSAFHTAIMAYNQQIPREQPSLDDEKMMDNYRAYWAERLGFQGSPPPPDIQSTIHGFLYGTDED